MGATLNYNLGTCHLKRGESDESLEHLHKALVIAEEINSRSLSYQVHQALSEATDQKEDYARALQHHRAFHRCKEEVFNTEADKKITGLVTRFEVEKPKAKRKFIASKMSSWRRPTTTCNARTNRNGVW